MPKNIFSIWKIAVFAGVLAVSLLFWLNDHVGYTAKSALLFNVRAADEEATITKTVAGFANTNTFVERTLSSTRLQDGAVGQMDPDQQQKLMDTVSVRGGKQGGLVVIEASDLDSDVAEVATTESAETLIRMSRLYLGDEKVFTITVIDKAILTKGLIHPAMYALKSIVTAIAVFVILILLTPAFVWLQGKAQTLRSYKSLEKEGKLTEESTEETDQRFVPQKLDPTFLYPEKDARTEEAPFPHMKASEIVNKKVFGHVESSDEKSPLQSVSVSMEDLPFSFETPVEETSPIMSEEKEAVTPLETLAPEREPSVLEYKRRLNELLAQK